MSVMGITPAVAFELPPFSWDTLPVAYHSCNSSGMFSDDQLQILAKYASVTIEKEQNLKSLLSPGYSWTSCQQDSNLTLCGCCAEDYHAEVGRRLKSLNPNITVISYKHSTLAHPWYQNSHELAAKPELWARNSSGDLVNTGWPWFTFDHAQADGSDLWEQGAMDLIKTGHIDGIFADGCIKAPAGLAPDVNEKYMRGKEAAMRRVQTAAPGPVVCGSNGKFVDGLAATQIQNWGKGEQWSVREIPMLFRAVQAGVMFQAHGPCPSDASDPTIITNLAAFLVAMGPHSYWMCGGWSGVVPTWYPVYDYPLGEPQGNATLVDGIYTRHFKSGTIATFDTTREVGSIQWATSKLVV